MSVMSAPRKASSPLDAWFLALREVERLPLALRRPGWDGHNASPISGAAHGEVVDFLGRLFKDFGGASAPAPMVAPDPDGGIALEWSRDDDQGHRELEIVFLARGNEYSIGYRGCAQAEEEGEDQPVWKLLNLVRQFVS
jgi:hypothetical protein